MNNYSKKAVKTAASVGMSLAMVLSATAPVMANETETYAETCDTAEIVQAQRVLKELQTALEDAGLSIETMKLTDYVGELTVKEFLSTESAVNAIKTYNDCIYSEEETIAGKLAGFVEGVEDAETKVKELAVKFNKADETFWLGEAELTGTGEYFEVDELTSKSSYDTAKALLKVYTDTKGNVKKYEDNMATELVDALNTYVAELEVLIENYQEDNITATTKEYVATLNGVVLYGTVTIETVMDDNAEWTIPHSQYRNIEKIVEKLRDNKDVTLAAGTVGQISDYNHDNFVGEDKVDEIFDTLDTIVEDINEVHELVTSTASRTLVTNFNKVKAAGTKFAAAIDKKGDVEEFEEAMGHVSTTDLAKITDYVDEYFSNFYEVEVKERANGSFRAELNATSFVNYVSNSEVSAEAEWVSLLTAMVNAKEEETTLFDLVSERKTGIEKALDAITEELKGITVNNLNAANVSKVMTAETAYEMLTTSAEDFGYADNLTKTETTQVKSAKRNVEALVNKMYASGIVAGTVGWVDCGNGDWDYYNEDGTPAEYKWVASHSDWYFIKDGKMVRNSWLATSGGRWYYLDNDGKMVTNKSIDGCWINSYGVYMSPTYKG